MATKRTRTIGHFTAITLDGAPGLSKRRRHAGSGEPHDRAGTRQTPGTRPAVRPCTACAGSDRIPTAAAAIAALSRALRRDMLKGAAAQPSPAPLSPDAAASSLGCLQRWLGPAAPEISVAPDDWTGVVRRGGAGDPAPKRRVGCRCVDRKARRCASAPCAAPRAGARDATVSALECMCTIDVSLPVDLCKCLSVRKAVNSLGRCERPGVWGVRLRFGSQIPLSSPLYRLSAKDNHVLHRLAR